MTGCGNDCEVQEGNNALHRAMGMDSDMDLVSGMGMVLGLDMDLDSGLDMVTHSVGFSKALTYILAKLWSADHLFGLPVKLWNVFSIFSACCCSSGV